LQFRNSPIRNREEDINWKNIGENKTQLAQELSSRKKFVIFKFFSQKLYQCVLKENIDEHNFARTLIHTRYQRLRKSMNAQKLKPEERKGGFEK